MTATDELRRLLTDAGVEYGGSDAVVYFEDERGYKACAYDAPRRYGKGVLCVIHTATTEQAIAATLGRRGCHKLPASGEKTCIVRHNSTHLMMEFGYWRCSECGCECFEDARYCMNCGAKVVGK